MEAAVVEKTALAIPMPGEFAPEAEAASADLVEISAETNLAALVGDSEHLVFQSAHWMATWFSAIGGKNILKHYWLTLRDDANEPILALPLVLREEGGLRVIEAPDCGVSDYVGPLFYRRSRAAKGLKARSFWAKLKAVLPPADLLRFEGLKANIGGHANPLIEHALAVPHRQSGCELILPERWEDFFAGLGSRMRDLLGKKRRRFLSQPGARVAVAGSAAEALEWLDHLDQMQSQRFADKGHEVPVTSVEFSHFYRKLAETGVPAGHVIMVGLFAENEVVALSYAVRCGERATFLRVGNQFGPWTQMSPGSLVTEQLIRHVHALGVRIFDFGLGEYEHKRRFGARAFALTDVTVPLSLKGLPYALKAYAVSRLRRSELLRKLTGRPSLQSAAQKNPNECTQGH